MKHTLFLSCLTVAVCLTLALGAQTPQTTTTTNVMDSAAITLTGCVAAGTAPNTWVLNNVSIPLMEGPTATTSTSTATRDATATTSTTTTRTDNPPAEIPRAESRASASASAGSVNLREHVGHRVEVTGTWSSTPSGAAAGMATAPQFMVKSVRMVSSSCP